MMYIHTNHITKKGNNDTRRIQKRKSLSYYNLGLELGIVGVQKSRHKCAEMVLDIKDKKIS